MIFNALYSGLGGTLSCKTALVCSCVPTLMEIVWNRQVKAARSHRNPEAYSTHTHLCPMNLLKYLEPVKHHSVPPFKYSKHPPPNHGKCHAKNTASKRLKEYSEQTKLTHEI